jgi:2-(1,2-epoxy-1,2-dihydrophenyl)acetyl-CoA isomerase
MEVVGVDDVIDDISDRAARRTIETGTDTIRVEVSGRVGVITLTRPGRRNALHDEMYAPAIAAIESFAADPAVGCIVVTGEGAGFCAGGDIRDGSGRRADGSKPTDDERVAHLAEIARFGTLLRESPILTIAAVNGAAAGAGMALALACDLRIATASARFIGGWVRLGFSGDFGGAYYLTRRVGESRAIEILASNRPIGADEALALGMVERVVPDAEFPAAWRAWAASLAAGPKAAIGLMKQNVLDASRLPLADAVVAEARRQVESSRTDDHREAIRAWVDKREPRFGPQPG